jgi:metal-responsive CopG/Arc/MetJ family transcriptional regulator
MIDSMRNVVQTTKIAISLPASLLDRIEHARQPGQSRSELITRAVEAYLGDQQARAEAEAYAQGYALFPETLEEIAAIDRLGVGVLAMEPWEPTPPPSDPTE